MAMTYRVILVLVSALISAPVFATTIEFDAPDAALPYSEDGFSIELLERPFQFISEEELVFTGFPGSGVSITNDAGLDFRFNSFDVASFSEGSPTDLFSLFGFKDGVQIVDYGTLNTALSTLVHVVTLNTTVIDELRIVGFNFAAGGPARIDNINVTAVPLPAAAWLFISGLAGLFGVKRLRCAA